MNYYYKVYFTDNSWVEVKDMYAFKLERYLHNPNERKIWGNWFRIDREQFINMNQAINVVMVENEDLP